MLAKYKRSIVITMLIAPFVLLVAEPANANQANPALTLLTSNEDGSEYGISLQILVLMTVLTVVPSILIMMTSFTRIIIVLSLLRQALGTAQTPPNQPAGHIQAILSGHIPLVISPCVLSRHRPEIHKSDRLDPPSHD